MNQQRSRRFRSAEETKAAAEKIKGDKEMFDGNCITPGTLFMQELQQALQLLIAERISVDPKWRACKSVILSGSNSPGEGEHKIMDYIRQLRDDPAFDPNTRHCLYGLDADLIMLGLLSHEPHLSLLREEVTFGRTPSRSTPKSANDTKFYLMHLCLLRDYFEVEFASLFRQCNFTLETFIDDVIAFSILVGNDFLPHIPHLHINENAFGMIFDAYKALGTHSSINDNGVVNFSVLERFFEHLLQHEYCCFLRELGEDCDVEDAVSTVMLSVDPAQLKSDLVTFAMDRTRSVWLSPLRMSKGCRKAVLECTRALNLNALLEENHRIVVAKEDDYQITSTHVPLDGDEPPPSLYSMHREWKRAYYSSKMEMDSGIEECLRSYCTGIAWILAYYYEGTRSWSWYYPFHYAPFVSDLIDYLAVCRVRSQPAAHPFVLGKPFSPIEQLMAVLPSASAKLVPAAFATLMTDPMTSPIIDFYPAAFDVDLNGKKNAWEAVVKIPFIDERRLLLAMTEREGRMTAADISRNALGAATLFTYDANVCRKLTTFRGTVIDCYTRERAFVIGRHAPIAGLLAGVAYEAGFPTLKSLEFHGELRDGVGIHVFGSPSRDPSVCLTLSSALDLSSLRNLVGSEVAIDYPFLKPASVAFVSDELLVYSGGQRQVPVHGPFAAFRKIIRDQLHALRTHKGIFLACEPEAILWVNPFAGYGSDGRRQYRPDVLLPVLPALVKLGEHPESLPQRAARAVPVSLREIFPKDSPVLLLAPGRFYGATMLVTANAPHIAIAAFGLVTKVYDYSDYAPCLPDGSSYVPLDRVAEMVGIPSVPLSRLTARLSIAGSHSTYVGLNLKSDAKDLRVPGYAQKTPSGWCFSARAIDLIRAFKSEFGPFVNAFCGVRSNDVLDPEVLFGPSNGERDYHRRRIDAMNAWLKKRGPKSALARSCNELLSEEEVKLLLQSNKKTIRTSFDVSSAPEMASPAQLVSYWHAEQRALSANETFRLGDRVACINVCGVPFGEHASVVGIEYPVVGDKVTVLTDPSEFTSQKLTVLTDSEDVVVAATHHVVKLAIRAAAAAHKKGASAASTATSAPSSAAADLGGETKKISINELFRNVTLSTAGDRSNAASTIKDLFRPVDRSPSIATSAPTATGSSLSTASPSTGVSALPTPSLAAAPAATRPLKKLSFKTAASREQQ